MVNWVQRALFGGFMRKLFRYLSDYKKECILGPLFKLLESCFDLTVPIVMAMVIDKGIANKNLDYVLFCGGLLVLLAVVGLASALTAQYFAAKAAVGFATKLREALFAHMETLSFKELDQVGSSTMITRMTSDINQVQNGTNMALRLFLRSPFIVFGAMIMAFTRDAKAALIFVVVIPLLAIVVFGVMWLCMPLYRRVQEGLDQVLGRVRQNLTGVRVLRAFHLEAQEEKQFQRENETLTKRQLFVGKVAALTNPVTYILINGALVLLLWTGALRINSGNLSTGNLIALVNYMSQILVELIKLANTIVLTTKAASCGGRIQSILEMESSLQTRESDNTSRTTLAGMEQSETLDISAKCAEAVSFENVTLTYQKGGDPAIENINFSIKRGELVGVIGGTGSGKSSLIHLIPRFYDVTHGCVRVSGQCVQDYSLKDLREQIGIVLQKAVLFQGSLRDNLRFGNVDATDEEMIKALKDAQAYDFVMEQKEGLDTMIEQGGRNLSGGQRQRITIARALVRKPKILILDDSMSALDLATDARLRQALGKLEYHPTIIVVSQRTSSIQWANQIFVMEDGKMVGCGNHQELMDNCEVYQEIHYSQFPKEKGGVAS